MGSSESRRTRHSLRLKQHDRTSRFAFTPGEGCITLKKNRLLQASEGTSAVESPLPLAGNRTMTKGASSTILQLIRRVALDERVRQLSDHELLWRFTGQGDEAAFH